MSRAEAGGRALFDSDLRFRPVGQPTTTALDGWLRDGRWTSVSVEPRASGLDIYWLARLRGRRGTVTLRVRPQALGDNPLSRPFLAVADAVRRLATGHPWPRLAA